MDPKKKRRLATRRARKQAESAWAAAERGELHIALRELQRAIARRQDNPRLWNDYGVLLWQSGQAREAIRAFRNALIFTPGYADVHAHLAEVYHGLEKTRLAAKHMRRAMELDPSTPGYRRRFEELERLDAANEAAGEHDRDDLDDGLDDGPRTPDGITR